MILRLDLMDLGHRDGTGDGCGVWPVDSNNKVKENLVLILDLLMV